MGGSFGGVFVCHLSYANYLFPFFVESQHHALFCTCLYLFSVEDLAGPAVEMGDCFGHILCLCPPVALFGAFVGPHNWSFLASNFFEGEEKRLRDKGIYQNLGNCCGSFCRPDVAPCNFRCQTRLQKLLCHEEVFCRKADHSICQTLERSS